MKAGNVLGVLALLCVWILLMESVSVLTLVSGLVFSILTLWFCGSALPLGKISSVNFFKLAMYPLFLIGQVYLAGFYVIKLIFTEASIGVVQVKTDITNESLRVILQDSLTLTPGSILIKPDGNRFTVLWLKGKAEEGLQGDEIGDAIKGKMEDWLIKAQK